MTTRVITFWRLHAASMTTTVSAMRFLIEIILIVVWPMELPLMYPCVYIVQTCTSAEAIQFHLKWSCYKRSNIIMVISYEIFNFEIPIHLNFI